MKCIILITILTALLLPTAAMSQDEHSGHKMEQKYPEGYHEIETSPEVTEGIKKYALDDDVGVQKNFGKVQVHDNEIFYKLMADRLEWQSKDGDPIYLWDVSAWVGTDYNKLQFESEAEYLIEEDEFEGLEVEAFYMRNIASFWDLKLGVRHDFEPDPERTFAAFGFEGLAPYWIETEIVGYVSNEGDFSAKLELEYELLLTQRLILMPRLEAGFSAQDVEDYGIGQGITDYEAGLRLKYEIWREFAPYIGVSWSQMVGETGTIADNEGIDTEKLSLVLGISAWH